MNIGHYYPQEQLLPAGNIGNLYRGYDALDREIAIKIVHDHVAQQPGFSGRFLKAASQLDQLDHPGIVRVYHWQSEPLALVTAYVSHQNLHIYGQLGSQELTDLLDIVIQVADALAYAHGQGVVHGDLKPNNILLKPGQAVVTDFGFTRLLQEVSTAAPFAPSDSLPYISPEHCLGRPLDGRSDIYSLGVILYELIANQMPLPISSLEDALQKHPLLPAVPLRQHAPDTSPPLEAVVMRLLRKSPVERFQSAAELAQALRAVHPQPALVATSLALPPAANWQQPLPEEAQSTSGSILPEMAAAVEGDHITFSYLPPRYYDLRGKESIVIGRSPTCDLVVDAPSIAPQHARLTKKPAGWCIEDMNSQTGVFLNDRQIRLQERWYPHQTLRLGNIYLKLYLADVAEAEEVKTFDLMLSPERHTVAPGEEAVVRAIVHNRGQERDYYQARLEVPETGGHAGWFVLEQDAFPLEPGQEGQLPLRIQPFPQSQHGNYTYSLTVQSLATGAKAIVKEGHIFIPPINNLELTLSRSSLHEGEEVEIIIGNRGNVETNCHFVVDSHNKKLKFALSAEQAARSLSRDSQPATPLATGLPNAKFRVPSLLRRLPVIGPLLRQLEQNALARGIRSGRSQMHYAQSLGQQAQQATGPPTASDANPAAAEAATVSRSWVRTHFAARIEDTVEVPAGAEKRLVMGVRAGDRPFVSARPAYVPFTVTAVGGQSRQEQSGLVAVQPRFTPGPITMLLLPLLLCCFTLTLSAFIVNFDESWQIRAAERAYARADNDNDGLSNGEEIRLGTDPDRADTDGDGVPDGQEVENGTDPLDPADRPPTATPIPTETPTATSIPAESPPPSTEVPLPTAEVPPTATPPPIYSRSSATFLDKREYDVPADESFFLVGDEPHNRQLEGQLEFTMGTFNPDGATPQIKLQLWLNNQQPDGLVFDQLGPLYVSLLPADGQGAGLILATWQAAGFTPVSGAERRVTIDLNQLGHAAKIVETWQRPQPVRLRLFFELPTNGDSQPNYLVFAGNGATTDAGEIMRPYLEIHR